MPQKITQYRVFIGSPSGLDDERQRFRKTLDEYTLSDCNRRAVHFHPVGWETTLGGVGRPQELINAELDTCDYAVFVLHDHWGSRTGNGYTSGFHEEWERAERLYEQRQIRKIVLFFMAVDPNKLADPGDQLKQVLDFRKRVFESKHHLVHSSPNTEEFDRVLRRHLAEWLHLRETPSAYATGNEPAPPPTASLDPGFTFWMTESQRLAAMSPPDHAASLFCAEKAAAAATSDVDWADAANAAAVCHGEMDRPQEAIAGFETIIAKFTERPEPISRAWHAYALVNKGVALGRLGGDDAAIAAYDDLLAGFATDPAPALREPIARALLKKGNILGMLGRDDVAIAAYDDLLARFAINPAPALREWVATALVNKGVRLGTLKRNDEAIAAYSDVLAQFASDEAPALRKSVAYALLNKGFTLGTLGRDIEEIATYDELLARFASDRAPALREQVAKALLNKGVTLGTLGRDDDEIAAYDDLLARFATDPAPALRERVAKALLNKGITLGTLGRDEAAIAAHDDLLARFAADPAPALQEIVATVRRSRGDG